MDLIRHCAEQPNIRARALLRSRALNEHQLNHFLILACAQLIRTYIMQKQEHGASVAGEPQLKALLRRMNIPTLAARVNLESAFTTQVIRELAPEVIAQLHRAFGSEHSMLNLLDSPNAV
jgi:hypothetical protein